MGKPKYMSERKHRRAIIEGVCLELEQFDAQVLHPWRLSDCLRFKLGLIPKRRVRVNPLLLRARRKR